MLDSYTLESDYVKLGTLPEQRTVLGKPFPLVLEPKLAGDGDKVNFVRLQEYMQKHHNEILRAASEYGAVMFKGFEISSGEEWASVLYQTGLK